MATKSLSERKKKSTWWPPNCPSWFLSKKKEKTTIGGPLGRPSQFNVEMTWWPPSGLPVGKKKTLVGGHQMIFYNPRSNFFSTWVVRRFMWLTQFSFPQKRFLSFRRGELGGHLNLMYKKKTKATI
jgi:hypothetical protein